MMGIKHELRDHYVVFWKEKPGFKGRVYAKCIECIYDPVGGKGGWREQVEACSNSSCPLYDVRPKKLGKSDLEDEIIDQEG